MKLQDYFPYDSAIFGLNGLFYTKGLNSFFVNSKCIQTKGKIITNGISYLIASTSDNDSNLDVHKVTLMDVLFYEGHVYLFVLNLETDKHHILNLPIKCPNIICDWLLYDWDEQIMNKDYRAIKDYCKCCTDSKSKPDAKRKSIITNDDLMDFDY
jgi:hypothetical protein